MKEQECWKLRTIGVSLNEQRRLYPKAFKPWSAKEKVRLKVEDQVSSLKENLGEIVSANDVLSLQKWLLIGNVNDFMMRDDPTLQDIEALGNDFKKWGMMVHNHLTGGREGRRRHSKAIETCIKAAVTKFKQLSSRVHTRKV